MGEIPNSILNGSQTGTVEILTGKQRAAAGCTLRRINMGIAEQNPFFSNAVKVWRFGYLVPGCAVLNFCIRFGITAPVVGKDKKDIGPFILFAFGACGKRCIGILFPV